MQGFISTISTHDPDLEVEVTEFKMLKVLFKFLRLHYFLTLTLIWFMFHLMKILHSAITPHPPTHPQTHTYTQVMSKSRSQTWNFPETKFAISDELSCLMTGLVMACGPVEFGGAKVLCILHHWGVQLILAYSWARPAILVVGKGRGGMFLFLLFLHFLSYSSFFPVPLFHLLYSLFYLFSPFLWETTQNDPQGLACR